MATDVVNKKSDFSIKLEQLPSGVTDEQIRNLISSICEDGFSISLNEEEQKSSGSANTEAKMSCLVTLPNRGSVDSLIKKLKDKEIDGHKLNVSSCDDGKQESVQQHPVRNLKMENSRSEAQQCHHYQQRNIDFPLRILVQSEMVGAIIGRSGQTIRNITQQTRARVDVHRKENLGSAEKAITIYGQPENLTKACHQILKVMEDEAKNTGKTEDIPLKILAHNNLIGRIIGKNGATINKIMEDTNTKITVSSIHDIDSFNMERIISIKGKIDDMSRAESDVSAKLRSAYESDIYSLVPHSGVAFPGLHPSAVMSGGAMNSSSLPPRIPNPMHPRTDPMCPSFLGFQHYPPLYSSGNNMMIAPPPVLSENGGATSITQETTYLYIPNSSVGAVIGTKGAYIRNVIKSSGASVKIAPVIEGTEPDPNGRKVTIVGSPDAQWRAQYLIYDTLLKEATGAGVANDVRLHAEIKVPSSQVGRIIGKGGSRVRETQRLTGAIIKLPEQGSKEEINNEETSVHVIGQFFSVQSGLRRIRALIQSSLQPSNNNPLNGDHHHHVIDAGSKE